tara:strand:+ start:97 stop:483 length:387 start_codon:yes stop_codon:yes gene_type:complete
MNINGVGALADKPNWIYADQESVATVAHSSKLFMVLLVSSIMILPLAGVFILPIPEAESIGPCGMIRGEIIEKDTDIVYQILTQHELIIIPDNAENNSTQIIIVPWAVYETYEVGDIYDGPLCGIVRH